MEREVLKLEFLKHHFQKIVEAGVTTVIGVLGTDSTTRNVENIVAKAKGLKEEGISCYVTTGAYEFHHLQLQEQ